VNNENRLLIEDFVNGDLAAFREIIDSCAPRVHAIAYQMCGNSADAQDIAQEVFLRLYRSRDKFDPNYRFSTWLHRLTVNVSIDFLRKHARPQEHSFEESEKEFGLEDKTSDPGRELERSELGGALRRLAGRLSLKQREVFVLRDLQGFSSAEVAEILDCRETTVRVHLAAARMRIKEALLKQYPEYAGQSHGGRRE
jgi:RNA polymerase sigma-70 factor, ECF subfamily